MNAVIAAPIQPLAVPIDSLKAHPENYRKGDVGGIMSSLQRFGQLRPILVQESTRYVVAGNHTRYAAERLGWTEIAAVLVNMTDDEALAYLVADNRLSDKAENDDESLIAALEKLQLTDLGLEGVGFTPDDVDDLVAAINGAKVLGEEDFEGGYAEDPDATAARWEGRDEGQNKEVVFLLPHEKYEHFRECLESLKKKYGTDSMAMAVYMAVDRESGVTVPSEEDGDWRVQ